MTIPLTILGGYLGAGKTTLLNHLLADPQGERLALIINDFGAINIDAALVASASDEQINLTNGCVCCGMSAGFDEALTELLERDPLPDRIIVEASGVAGVVSLGQYGYHGGLRLDGIVVLADAESVRAKASDKYVAETVKRQLRGADLIVLNKADLVDAARCASVLGWLKELAPSVPVLTTSQAEVPREVLFDLTHRTAVHGVTVHRPEHEHYATWHYESERPLPRVDAEAFVAALPDWVLRGKGFLKLEGGAGLLFQQVGQRQTLEPQSDVGQTAIVVIGLAEQFERSVLDDLAARYLSGG